MLGSPLQLHPTSKAAVTGVIGDALQANAMEARAAEEARKREQQNARLKGACSFPAHSMSCIADVPCTLLLCACGSLQLPSSVRWQRWPSSRRRSWTTWRRRTRVATPPRLQM